MIFANGGRFQANLAVAKNCASIAVKKLVFPRISAAASENSPMRRGLKFVLRHGPLSSREASENSPMRRGLKFTIHSRPEGHWPGFREFPDEEGTEMNGIEARYPGIILMLQRIPR
jgi:hypothetical protein